MVRDGLDRSNPQCLSIRKKTWVVFGGYDGKVHFLDAETGERMLSDFETGDIIKTSVTIDPDGFPLAYFGSRDDYFRIVAFDRGEPVELWSLNAYEVPRVRWNDDWDSSPIVIDDHLFLAGENSYFFIYRLNRSEGPEGVEVSPELVVADGGLGTTNCLKTSGRATAITPTSLSKPPRPLAETRSTSPIRGGS